MNKKPYLNKILIINSKANMDAVYTALLLANGALEQNIKAELFCTFFGLEMLDPKKMDHLHVATVGNPGLHIPTLIGGLPGMQSYATNLMKKDMEEMNIPPISKFLQQFKETGGKVFACKLSSEMFHYEADALWEGIDGMLTVGEFYNRVEDEASQIIFI